MPKNDLHVNYIIILFNLLRVGRLNLGDLASSPQPDKYNCVLKDTTIYYKIYYKHCIYNQYLPIYIVQFVLQYSRSVFWIRACIHAIKIITRKKIVFIILIRVFTKRYQNTFNLPSSTT